MPFTYIPNVTGRHEVCLRGKEWLMVNGQWLMDYGLWLIVND